MGIPIVLMAVASRGFEGQAVREAVASLDERLEADELGELHRHIGRDLGPFKRQLIAALEPWLDGSGGATLSPPHRRGSESAVLDAAERTRR